MFKLILMNFAVINDRNQCFYGLIVKLVIDRCLFVTILLDTPIVGGMNYWF